MARYRDSGEVVAGSAPPGSPEPRGREELRRRPYPWEPKFLARFAEGWSVTHSAKAAGIDRKTASEARERNPAFAAAWDDAYEQGTDHLEHEARRRAEEGTERPVFYKGEVVGAVREYSDRLMEISLKARRPAKWREQVALELSGSLQPSAEELAAAREEGKAEEVERAMRVIAKTAHVRAA